MWGRFGSGRAFGAPAVMALALSVALGGMATAADSKERSSPVRWSWLAGTTWIVPETNLPAVSFDPSTQEITSISDQTVYQVTGYRDGYFWGRTGVQLEGQPTDCFSLVGSVTPQGRVLLLFSQTLPGGRSTLLQGWGEMIRKNGAWTMQNQTGNVTMTHWAYMVQSEPGDPSWDSLPGVGVSVDDFLASCPAGPHPADQAG